MILVIPFNLFSFVPDNDSFYRETFRVTTARNRHDAQAREH